MNGGGADDTTFKLGDISQYNEVSDLGSIASASLVGLNMALIGGRIGGLGGLSLNAYFDAFGIEGFLSNISLILILFQAARWGYTSFYNVGGSRPWSPFVFVCILIGIQLLHDLIFYYGAINMVPSGKNEMIDVLKKYSAENGSRALGAHSLFLIVIAVIAMFLKEASLVFGFIVTSVAVYLMPFIIATFGPKPAPPPKIVEKKESVGMANWNGPRF